MSEHSPARPYFLPENVEFETLPKGLQAVVAAILDPLYKELVLGAEDSLERDAGKTLVHLAWLEVIGQIEVGQQIATGEKLLDSEEHYKLIERLLRVVGAKSKLQGFLLNLRKLRKAGSLTGGFRHAGSEPKKAAEWAGPVTVS
jgi:hypothetical protein